MSGQSVKIQLLFPNFWAIYKPQVPPSMLEAMHFHFHSCYVLYKKLQNAVVAFIAMSKQPQQLALCKWAVSVGAGAEERCVVLRPLSATQRTGEDLRRGGWQSRVWAEEIQAASSALALQTSQVLFIMTVRSANHKLRVFCILFNGKKATLQLLIPNVYRSDSSRLWSVILGTLAN